jgi:DHA3 family multidrug efflux protein-like MFS transporter
MVLAATISASCFAVATAVFVAVDSERRLEMRGPWFWILVTSTLLGSVAGQMRGIALSTCVTLLVPEGDRDKANGLVGAVSGLSFAITSVFSALVIGQLGMGWALYGSLALKAAAPHDPARQPRQLDGVLRLHVALLDRPARGVGRDASHDRRPRCRRHRRVVRHRS